MKNLVVELSAMYLTVLVVLAAVLVSLLILPFALLCRVFGKGLLVKRVKEYGITIESNIND